MAEGIRFICNQCSKSIEAWDDGNPYFFDENGDKQYAYHPSSELDRCVGNDSPYLCLNCSEKFMVDSQEPISACPKCASEDICSTFSLSKKKCPFCKVGILERDTSYYAIS